MESREFMIQYLDRHEKAEREQSLCYAFTLRMELLKLNIPEFLNLMQILEDKSLFKIMKKEFLNLCQNFKEDFGYEVFLQGRYVPVFSLSPAIRVQTKAELKLLPDTDLFNLYRTVRFFDVLKNQAENIVRKYARTPIVEGLLGQKIFRFTA